MARPYTDADDEAMTLLTPASAAASTISYVPSTSTSSASRGSVAHWVILIAARWNTRSVSRHQLATSDRSRMSPSTRRTCAGGQGAGQVLPAASDEVVEHDDLAAPAATSWSTTVEPMVPPPPVTRHLLPLIIPLPTCGDRDLGAVVIRALRSGFEKRREPARPKSASVSGCLPLARSSAANSTMTLRRASRSGNAGACMSPSR